MQNPLLQQIDAIAKEKGVEPEIIIGAVQDAIEAAARKRYKNETLRARFNTDTGQIELCAVKRIVDEVTDPPNQISLAEAQQLYGDEAEVDMEIEFPRPTEDLGRIAAQTAKQVIFQKVREAERENVYAEYSQRVGDVVSGMVKRFENGDIIIELGRVEAQLPRKEQSRAENYTVGDRVRAVIRGVNRSAKGPQIVLSRTDPALLIKLFEQEVPEIYDGTVMIRGAVREAGDRAKVAVYSRERDVDPVGACVGMKGTRVQSIIRELRGEKIDIIPFNEDIVVYAQNSLAPAKITRVSVTSDEQAHRPHLDVIVDNDQLSLAIGKRGLNVRLAAELIGAKIDIKSEEEVKGEVADALTAMLQEAMAEARAATNVHDIENMPPDWADRLEEAGYDDHDSVVNASIDDLTAIPDVDEEMARQMIELAQKHEQLIEEEPVEESEEESEEESDEEYEASAEDGEEPAA